MDSRADSIQFRSVPLIQRRDLAQLGGTSSPRRDDAAQTTRPSRAARVSADPGGRRLSSREDSRRTRGRTRTRTRANRERAQKAPDHEPLRESVSAHMGESSVVRVTRRSERWAADDGSGFRLVPERDEAPNPSFGERGPVAERPAEHPLATDYGWNATRAHTGASDRRSRALAAGGDRSGLQGVALSGSRSRHNAIRSGISAIPRGIASLIEGTLGHTRGVTVLVVVALVVAMLYTPLCNLYAAHRRLGHLQATYDALLAENESINHDLEVLQSREGIENVARARGYVEAGETKVIVEGLADEGQQEDQALAAISDVEVPDERPWYIVALDTLFGYTAEQ